MEDLDELSRIPAFDSLNVKNFAEICFRFISDVAKIRLNEDFWW